jgi:hypothetical protein
LRALANEPKKLGGRNAEAARDSYDVQKTDIAFAALYAAD